MIGAFGEEGGYSMMEMLVVMVILGVVLGGIVTMFTAGINADADQSRRYESQQEGRNALDRLRREIHSGCTISAPSTYNSAMGSATLYFASDSCASGSHTVTYCTSGGGTRYALYRIVATTCTGATQRIADYLTSASPFIYLPPNSHLVTSTSLGQGTSSSYLATQDGSSTLPRLHVDVTINRKPSNPLDGFRMIDDIALRNGPRACSSGVASC